MPSHSSGLERSDRNGSREADHAPSGVHQEQNTHRKDRECKAVWSEPLLATKGNEKAVRQQDGLLFQGRIVPTEFKKDHQNFLAKSYWAAKGSVKEFFQNKCICFQ
jgi:hypothetical protein